MIDSKTKIAVPLVLVVGIFISLGTSFYNIWNKNNEERFSNLGTQIEKVESKFNESSSILHRRISGMDDKIRLMEKQLVNNSNYINFIQREITQVRQDIRDLKNR